MCYDGRVMDRFRVSARIIGPSWADTAHCISSRRNARTSLLTRMRDYTEAVCLSSYRLSLNDNER